MPLKGHIQGSWVKGQNCTCPSCRLQGAPMPEPSVPLLGLGLRLRPEPFPATVQQEPLLPTWCGSPLASPHPYPLCPPWNRPTQHPPRLLQPGGWVWGHCTHHTMEHSGENLLFLKGCTRQAVKGQTELCGSPALTRLGSGSIRWA